MTYTSAAEDAAKIRAELKRRGWSSRQVSVKSDTFSMGASIDVTIKAPGISLETVQEIAEQFERVRRCEITGEILSGGNRYVSVSFDYKLIDAEAAKVVPWLQALPIHESEMHPLQVGEAVFLVGRWDRYTYAVSLKGGSWLRGAGRTNEAGAAEVIARYAVEHGLDLAKAGEPTPEPPPAPGGWDVAEPGPEQVLPEKQRFLAGHLAALTADWQSLSSLPGDENSGVRCNEYDTLCWLGLAEVRVETLFDEGGRVRGSRHHYRLKAIPPCTCGGVRMGEPCDQTCATFEPVVEAREAEGIAKAREVRNEL